MFEWEHRWVPWPDFRAPTSSDDAIDALEEAYERSLSARVEVACGGGVGRTGTALAALAVLAGVPPAEAAAWVRQHYDRRAVETPWQRRWVRRLELPDGADGLAGQVGHVGEGAVDGVDGGLH